MKCNFKDDVAPVKLIPRAANAKTSRGTARARVEKSGEL
jgi:hypothetical protein